jgi:hypothetical protein
MLAEFAIRLAHNGLLAIGNEPYQQQSNGVAINTHNPGSPPLAAGSVRPPCRRLQR